MVQAANAFDQSLGVPFSGFATLRIRGALLDELRSLDWASRSVRRRARSVDSARADLLSSLGRWPTRAELAAGAGLSIQELNAHERDVAVANIGSLQVLDEGNRVGDFSGRSPEPIDVLLHREEMMYVGDAVRQLPARLQIVIQGYFLEQRPMAELAAELGVTESRVSQMRAQGLSLMRHALQRLLHGEPVVGTVGSVAQRRRDEYVQRVAACRRTHSRVDHRSELELTSIA